ncbi:hypothetical protein [Roseateles flavus]|uniref:Porin n=1 Tax=Roseateles flavus TaxID=3149041 RepID=A0ABV0G9K9_9BURK
MNTSKNAVLMLRIAALGAALGGAAPTQADDMRFTWSGFAQLTVAKVLSGTDRKYMEWQCPCAIQNWEYVGVYEKSRGWQADQESLLGLQGTLHVNDALSATAQVVSRANNKNYRPTLDWAYLSYALNDSWTLQAGRKRIPLYYYSDFLYIGTAYPWVRPAPDVYGWPIYAYDGANLAYSGALKGSWTLEGNVWAGNFQNDNAPYNTRIYWGDPTTEKWRNILGGYVTVSDGVYSARVMLMRFDNYQWSDLADGTRRDNLPGYRTTIAGLSFNYDGREWILRSEINRFQQATSDFVYNYFLVGLGYRWHDWTGMATVSRYRTQENNLGFAIEGRRTQSLALRYDLNKSVALKAQYDVSRDQSRYDFFGDHRLLSFSVQTAF